MIKGVLMILMGVALWCGLGVLAMTAFVWWNAEWGDPVVAYWIITSIAVFLGAAACVGFGIYLIVMDWGRHADEN